MEIIAEIGQNHNGDMELAKEMIFAAAEAGADTAKFQVYNAQSLFPKNNNPWFSYNCKTELSRNQVEDLFTVCEGANIEFMASVFDIERISWLEAIGVKRHKVASRSINDFKMIESLCRTGKELLVSLGMWNKKNFPEIPSKKTKFLYCISKYPTPLEEIKLSEVCFSEYHGFSDHSVGIGAAVAAFARGAGIVEKHFTLDKKAYGPDHQCSMTLPELKNLVLIKNQILKCL